MSVGIKAWAGSAEPWGGGFKAAVGALTDEVLLEKLARYKRQVAKRYRVVEPDVIEQLLPSEELHPAGLKAIGKNLFKESPASGAEIPGTPGLGGFGGILQGFLEMSNVNLAEEMVNMIVAQRAYEANSKSIQTSDSMLSTAIQLKRG